ncbi:MAG: hypothetical protein H8E82_01835 [Candidatus Marinimicrobia bacterium]|nr:hypothetical protein [Candidatus Neomarinimicrobiota bacterium]
MNRELGNQEYKPSLILVRIACPAFDGVTVGLLNNRLIRIPQEVLCTVAELSENLQYFLYHPFRVYNGI